MNKAVEWNCLSENPVKVKPLKVPKCENNWWRSEDVIQDFFQKLETEDAWGNNTRRGFKEPYRAALIMPLEIGPRVGEVCALKVSDINFKEHTVLISKTFNEKNLELEPTKNYEFRVLKFSPSSRLNRWLREACEGKGTDEHIFTTRTGKAILPNKLAEVFRKWLRRLEYPRITYHGLRHTFASWYLKRGGDIYELSRILGHKDIKVTIDNYIHHRNSPMRAISWDDDRFECGLKLGVSSLRGGDKNAH